MEIVVLSPSEVPPRPTVKDSDVVSRQVESSARPDCHLRQVGVLRCEEGGVAPVQQIPATGIPTVLITPSDTTLDTPAAKLLVYSTQKDQADLT